MDIKVNDEKISDRLNKIRAGVGVEKARFVPRPHVGRLEINLDGDKVESLFHPSGLLISENRPVFVYIRDHSTMSWLLDPKGLKRIHFTVCRTLRQMKKQGRWERYRVTNRDDDKYYIDLRDGETEARLFPCQNCLNEVGYQCFSYDDMPWWQRNQIVESFNAKEALDLLWQCFELFKEQVSTLGPATWASGYSPLHTQISRAYRAHKGFACEKCGVNLEHAKQCLDTHHISGVKNNNRYENLLCLCKLCHADEHPHYRTHAENYRRIIERARREQGINL